MCIFTSTVDSVSETQIFARMIAPGRQVLAYQMEYEAPGGGQFPDGVIDPFVEAHDANDTSLAMVLPIPVSIECEEHDVTFIDLSSPMQSGLFKMLDKMWPGERSRDYEVLGKGPTLAVKSVGSFDASFVPSLGDFERLDGRFRLNSEVWEKLPGYKDYGFAVFKLKAGSFRPHPMAFSFPTRYTGHLFFPTVHVHDGEAHAEEHFDHMLYAQTPAVTKWERSPMRPTDVATFKIVSANEYVVRKAMVGIFQNADQVLEC